MTDTPLIVTADDYGLTDLTCHAIIDAHRRGIVTATSVLAVAPGIERRLRFLDDVPSLSVGVHLALVGEDPPLLSTREIPTLVGAAGGFRPSWRQLLPALAAGRIDPDDMRRELEAQVALVAEYVQPTHLDTHQHVHLWPKVGSVVVALAVLRGVRAVRVPRATGGGVRARAINHLAARLAGALDRAGIEHTDRFCGLDEAGRWNAERLVSVLEVLARGDGSLECNVHPGAADDTERDRFAWGYAWGQELEAMVDPDVRRAVGRLRFELVSR